MPLGLHAADVTWRVGSPALLHDLYEGELAAERVEAALSELALARRELAANASACFFTDEGRDLFDVLLAALMRLRTADGSLRIVETVAA